MTPKTFEELFNNYATHLTNNSITTTLDNFKAFLEMSGYSLEHADSLYNHYINGTEPTFDIPQNEIKARGIDTISRKIGRVLLKKVLPAAIITGAVAGTALAGFGSAVIPAGSNFLWMEMGSNAALNFAKIAAETGAIAAAGNIAYFAGRSKYLSNKYSSQKSLTQLNSGVSLENTNLAKLMQKINITEQEILNLREGKWFTAPFRWAKSKVLLTNNAVRNLRVNKAYQELLAQFYNKLADKAPTNDQKYNDAEMKNIHKLLKHCSKHIHDDIERSLVYSLLSCKENKNHKHKPENVDIYANMLAYEKAIRDEFKKQQANAEPEIIQESMIKKAAKTNLKAEKRTITSNLVNRKAKLLEESLLEYEKLKPVPVAPVVTIPTITGWEEFYKGTKFALDNNKFLIVTGLDNTLISNAKYSGSTDAEIRISFNTSTPDTIYASGKELTKRNVEDIIQRRLNLEVIYNYIQDPVKAAELIASIPTTQIKLNNLKNSIQTVFNTSADFKLTGAASTLYNKVVAAYKADTGYTI